ncbi:unnamed protein product [Arabis nemorensis]|uniref:Uncharacterized protein n=1 Tax=Arabis nemorensis TaxID=586526 RepID=A0A565BZB0_9BRAS|nr:unnamed protein product [Arabis nemorensis]
MARPPPLQPWGVTTEQEFKVCDEIRKCILRMLRSMLKHPYEKYSDMPIDVKESWHRTFAQKFTWDHRRTTQVLQTFDQYAGIQYSRHMSQWKRAYGKKKKRAKDLEDHVWKGFCEYWSVPSTKIIYEKNSESQGPLCCIGWTSKP